jgi:hypothetical protein
VRIILAHHSNALANVLVTSYPVVFLAFLALKYALMQILNQRYALLRPDI